MKKLIYLSFLLFSTNLFAYTESKTSQEPILTKPATNQIDRNRNAFDKYNENLNIISTSIYAHSLRLDALSASTGSLLSTLSIFNNGNFQGNVSSINFTTNMTATVISGTATVSSSGSGGNTYTSSTRTICLCGYGAVPLSSVGFSPANIDWINDAYSTWNIINVQAVVTYPTTVGNMIFNANFSTRALTGVGAFRAIDATSWTITTGQTESGTPTIPSVKTQFLPREKMALTIPSAPTTGIPAGGVYGLLINAERTGP